MKASDTWHYRCACHAQPQDCCSIDYMIHAIDSATETLQDPKNFGDRFDIKQSQIKHLQSLMRRLYRLFSHTYFHHKDIFDEFESQMFLCKRFTHFSRQFKMMGDDQFIIPDEAIGFEKQSDKMD